MKPRNKLTAQERHIWSLRLVIMCLIVIVIAAIISGRTSVDEITVNVPPDLSQGYTAKANAIPPASVYSFVNTVFHWLNEWDDGSVDFEAAIEQVSCLITPAFRQQLLTLKQKKNHNNELARERHVSTLGHFNDTLVAQPTANTWLVWLDVTLDEYVGGHPVKQSAIRYPFSVQRDQRHCNPWKIALSGYAYRPERLGETQ